MHASKLVTAPRPVPATEGGALRRRSGIGSAPVLAVTALAIAGIAVRLVIARQSLYADELSTYWISATQSLGEVLSLMYGTGRIAHAEITPPLSFLASWVGAQLGHAPALLRAPSLIAGAATIPAVYMLGRRAAGHRSALVATALTALSPFMIYYSTEARAYGLMMLLLVCSTLSLLLAIDTRRRLWWCLYAACSAGAFYSHYTCSFALATQLLWALWAHPELRRPALVANAAAALLVVPWLPGLVNDLNSPTLRILSDLAPFSLHDIRVDILHWAVGYPYTFAGGLRALPGTPALILLGSGAVLALGGLGGLGVRARDERVRGRPRALAGLKRLDRRFVLLLALGLATPIGEIVVSAFGNHIFGVRDLAASWPYVALGAGSVCAAAGALGAAAAVLAVVAFGLGAARMLEGRFSRPPYQAAASFIVDQARSGDVVVDETGVVSPGPLTGLDVALHRRLPVFRGQTPVERDHPFGFLDRRVPLSSAVARAVATAHGHRVFVVTSRYPLIAGLADRVTPEATRFPESYRLVGSRTWDGVGTTRVAVYAHVGGAGG